MGFLAAGGCKKTKPIEPNQSQFRNVAGGDLAGGLVFSRLRRKGPMKDFMDFFRKTAGYDIDLRRKIA